MTLEFHMPQGSVHEWVVNYVRDNLLDLHNKDNQISRGEVYFREKPFGAVHNKLCEIELSIYGGTMFIQRRASSFEQAARDAIEALTEKIDERMKLQGTPPDEITSTVNV